MPSATLFSTSSEETSSDVWKWLTTIMQEQEDELTLARGRDKQELQRRQFKSLMVLSPLCHCLFPLKPRQPSFGFLMLRIHQVKFNTRTDLWRLLCVISSLAFALRSLYSCVGLNVWRECFARGARNSDYRALGSWSSQHTCITSNGLLRALPFPFRVQALLGDCPIWDYSGEGVLAYQLFVLYNLLACFWPSVFILDT
ncbi:hypothetical protein L208DRAFT_89558 [Tricholoma matsutake]|nr:hypothetical protein L208DRAFT_89558 [Tricholoma matsutake 945]